MYWREILRRSLTTDVLDSYEWFVITRSDFQWVVPHPKVELLDKEEIYLLDGEKYGGISDRHIIFHRNLASQIFDIAAPIFHESRELIREFSDKKIEELNPERFLSMMLERKGLVGRIRYLPYLGFSIRHKDTKSRWSQGIYNKKLGLYIKYPTEFRDSYRARFIVKSVEDWNTILNKKFHLRHSIIRLMQRTNSPKNLLMKVLRQFCRVIDHMLQR